MKAKALLSVLAAFALVSASTTVFAQKAGYTYDRLNVVEVFTSATCPPCAPAALQIDQVVGLAAGVVSVRHHVAIPVAGDPWQQVYGVDAQARYSYLSATPNTAPRVFINGNNDVPPQATTLRAVINSETAEKSPVELKVVQTGNSAKITLKTNVALSNYTLRAVVLSYHTEFTEARAQTITNWNGETEWNDAFLKFMPSINGIPINMSANSDDEFTVSYTAGTGELWPANQQYITAYLQDNTTKEIIQAGTSLKEVGLELTVAGNGYNKIDRGASDSRVVTLKNKFDVPITATLSVTDATQAGWAANLSSVNVTVPANGQATTTLNVTAPNRSWYQEFIITANSSAPAGYYTKASSGGIAYLSSGTKVVTYLGLNGSITPLAQGILNTAYGTDCAFITLSDATLAAYPPSEFKALVFLTDFNGRGNLTTVSALLQQLVASGARLWVGGPVDMAVATNPQYDGIQSFMDLRAFYSNTLGIQPGTPIARAQQSGNQITPFPYTLTGVAAGEVFAGAEYTLNQASNAYPFYTAASDVIVLSNGSKSKAILTSVDNNVTNINAVSWTNTAGSRVIYSTFGPELISDLAKRTSCIEKGLDWLLAEPAPIATLSVTSLNFGSLEVSKTKEMSVELTNTGTAPLTVTRLSISGDNSQFEITSTLPSVSAPITLAPNAKSIIRVTFKPTVVGNYIANLLMEANTPDVNQVTLRGASTVSSVETETVSETGAIGVRMVGANPVRTTGAIELRANDNVTVTMVDVAGKTVATLFDGIVNGTERVAIPAGTINSGTYSIVATNGADRAVLSVVVAR